MRFFFVIGILRRKGKRFDNSGAVRGSILRLGQLISPTSLTLDLLITLFVEMLRIEKIISCPAFSLMPTTHPVYSVESLGKSLPSELKQAGC